MRNNEHHKYGKYSYEILQANIIPLKTYRPVLTNKVEGLIGLFCIKNDTAGNKMFPMENTSALNHLCNEGIERLAGEVSTQLA